VPLRPSTPIWDNLASTVPSSLTPTIPTLASACEYMHACPCDHLGRLRLGIFADILHRFILIGILVSYLPQHYRIISRRSSFGLSPYFVLLGTTSGTCAFANILTLPASRKDIACCHEINGFPCFAGLLGVLQVGVQWSCFTIMYFTQYCLVRDVC
jgi:hypothetical protein